MSHRKASSSSPNMPVIPTGSRPSSQGESPRKAQSREKGRAEQQNVYEEIQDSRDSEKLRYKEDSDRNGLVDLKNRKKQESSDDELIEDTSEYLVGDEILVKLHNYSTSLLATIVKIQSRGKYYVRLENGEKMIIDKTKILVRYGDGVDQAATSFVRTPKPTHDVSIKRVPQNVASADSYSSRSRTRPATSDGRGANEDDSFKYRVGDDIEVIIVVDDKIEKFPAIVQKINEDGTYEVKYANGSIGHNVSPNTVKFVLKPDEAPAQVGDHVEIVIVLDNSVEKFPAVVERINADASYNVRYLNGKCGLGIPSNTVRLVKKSPPSSQHMSKVGDNIEVLIYVDKKLERFPGIIQYINEDGTYNIRYRNGKVGYNVSPNTLKFVRPDAKDHAGLPNERVEVVIFINESVHRFPGKIDRVNENGSYDILYLNGKIGRNISHNALMFPYREKKAKSRKEEAEDFLDEEGRLQFKSLARTFPSSAKDDVLESGDRSASAYPRTLGSTTADLGSISNKRVHFDESKSLNNRKMGQGKGENNRKVVHDNSLIRTNKKGIIQDNKLSHPDISSLSLSSTDGKNMGSIYAALYSAASVTEAAIKASASASTVTSEAVRAASLITSTVSSFLPYFQSLSNSGNVVDFRDDVISGKQRFNFEVSGIVIRNSQIDDNGNHGVSEIEVPLDGDDHSFLVGDTIVVRAKARVLKVNDDGSYFLDFGKGLSVPSSLLNRKDGNSNSLKLGPDISPYEHNLDILSESVLTSSDQLDSDIPFSPIKGANDSRLSAKKLKVGDVIDIQCYVTGAKHGYSNAVKVKRARILDISASGLLKVRYEKVGEKSESVECDVHISRVQSVMSSGSSIAKSNSVAEEYVGYNADDDENLFPTSKGGAKGRKGTPHPKAYREDDFVDEDTNPYASDSRNHPKKKKYAQVFSDGDQHTNPGKNLIDSLDEQTVGGSTLTHKIGKKSLKNTSTNNSSLRKYSDHEDSDFSASEHPNLDEKKSFSPAVASGGALNLGFMSKSASSASEDVDINDKTSKRRDIRSTQTQDVDDEYVPQISETKPKIRSNFYSVEDLVDSAKPGRARPDGVANTKAEKDRSKSEGAICATDNEQIQKESEPNVMGSSPPMRKLLSVNNAPSRAEQDDNIGTNSLNQSIEKIPIPAKSSKQLSKTLENDTKLDEAIGFSSKLANLNHSNQYSPREMESDTEGEISSNEIVKSNKIKSVESDLHKGNNPDRSSNVSQSFEVDNIGNSQNPDRPGSKRSDSTSRSYQSLKRDMNATSSSDYGGSSSKSSKSLAIVSEKGRSPSTLNTKRLSSAGTLTTGNRK